MLYLNLIKKIFAMTACLSILSWTNPAMAGKFYKWVDEKGSTHYTQTPPPKNAKKLDSLDTYDDSPSGSDTPQASSNNNEQIQSTTPAGSGEIIRLPPPQVDPTENQLIPSQNSNL